MARRERGDILIEVLIAVLVLGIGLLGVAAMQATALRNNDSAMLRSQAAMQVQTILDAMRANRTNAIAGAYVMSRSCTAPSGGSLAQNDLANWITGLHTTLGSGACGTVACVSGTCTVTVDWDDSRASDAGSDGVTAGSATYTVTASAQL